MYNSGMLVNQQSFLKHMYISQAIEWIIQQLIKKKPDL